MRLMRWSWSDLMECPASLVPMIGEVLQELHTPDEDEGIGV